MRYLATICTLLVSSSAWAQESVAQEYATDAYSVETKANQDGVFERRPERVETIDGAVLERNNVTNLTEALQWVSGATPVQPTGTSTGMVVDGLPTGQLTVLVDGAPISRPRGGPNGPMVNLDAIPVDPSNIDRIEVTRGMGPGGTGGVVVNVITKGANPKAHATIRGELGSGPEQVYGSSTSLTVGTPLAKHLTTQVFGQYRTQEPVDVNQDQTPDRPETKTLSGGFGLNWGRGQDRLSSSLRLRDNESIALSGPNAPLDDRVTETEFNGQIQGRWLSGAWQTEHVSEFAFMRSEFHKLVRESGNELLKADTSILSTTQRVGTTYLGDSYDLGVELDLGGEHVERTGETGRLSPETIGEVGLGLKSRLYVGDVVELHGRLRGAIAEPFGPSIAAEVGVAWSVVDSVVLRSNISRTRRVPTAEELFLFFDHSEVGYRVLGNPDLRPEILNSARLGAAWTPTKHFGLEFESFAHLIEDGIVTEAVGGQAGDFTSINAGELITAGVNSTMSINDIYGWFSTRVTYSFLPLARELETGDELALRTKHSVRAEVVGAFFQRALELRVMANGRAAMNVPEGSPAAPAYVTLGSGVSWRYDDHLRVMANVENLLDQTNATWGPIPGRHATFGMVAGF